MNLKLYKPWDFCKSINCNSMVRTEEQRKVLTCPSCKAYQMHDYLRAHSQILEEDSALSAKIEQLENDFITMTAEKERCRKLAVDYALKSDSFEMRLNQCENMKLAHEFEDLLQTTSIPVAVEKVKGLMAELEEYKQAYKALCFPIKSQAKAGETL